jgi:hypothetical protein
LEGDVGKTDEAIVVAGHHALEDELEDVARFKIVAFFHEQLGFETVLVDGDAGLGFRGVLDPLEGAIVITTLPRQVCKSVVGVDVVGTLLNDRLISIACQVELKEVLVEASIVKLASDAKCLHLVRQFVRRQLLDRVEGAAEGGLGRHETLAMLNLLKLVLDELSLLHTKNAEIAPMLRLNAEAWVLLHFSDSGTLAICLGRGDPLLRP